MNVICIDSSGKPLRIPQSQWPREGREYTVTGVIDFPDKSKGFLLEEIRYEPYDVCGILMMGYKASRFAQLSDAPENKLEEVHEDLLCH